MEKILREIEKLKAELEALNPKKNHTLFNHLNIVIIAGMLFILYLANPFLSS